MPAALGRWRDGCHRRRAGPGEEGEERREGTGRWICARLARAVLTPSGGPQAKLKAEKAAKSLAKAAAAAEAAPKAGAPKKKARSRRPEIWVAWR